MRLMCPLPTTLTLQLLPPPPSRCLRLHPVAAPTAVRMAPPRAVLVLLALLAAAPLGMAQVCSSNSECPPGQFCDLNGDVGAADRCQ